MNPWRAVGDGRWERDDGARIWRVNPRGRVFYAVQLPGWRRPEWVDTLAEARQLCKP